MASTFVAGDEGGVRGRRRAAAAAVPLRRRRRPADPRLGAAHPGRRRRQRRAVGGRAVVERRRRRGGRLATRSRRLVTLARRPDPRGRSADRPVRPDREAPRADRGPGYTAEHEWIAVVGEGDDAVLRIGITAYAQEALGDIVFVTLPAVGTELDRRAGVRRGREHQERLDVYAPGRRHGHRHQRRARRLARAGQRRSATARAGWSSCARPTASRRRCDADGLMDADAYAALVAHAPDPRPQVEGRRSLQRRLTLRERAD